MKNQPTKPEALNRPVQAKTMEDFKDETPLHPESPDRQPPPLAQEHFLARISHELRTPLTMIIGQSDALHEGIYGELTEEQNDAVSIVTQSGIHLLRLIDSILDYNRFSSENIRFTPIRVSVTSLIAAVRQMVEHQATAKEIQLLIEDRSGDLTIEVDEILVIQILVNLLDNAIKFTPENGLVKLSVSLANHDANSTQKPSGTVLFSVEDNGIGIAAEDTRQIFEPFIQVHLDDTTRRTGIGLGLSLVQQMVELHNGRIDVRSAPGHGSQFIVALPIHRPSSPLS